MSVDVVEGLIGHLEPILELRDQNLIRRLDLISKTLLEQRDQLREVSDRLRIKQGITVGERGRQIVKQSGASHGRWTNCSLPQSSVQQATDRAEFEAEVQRPSAVKNHALPQPQNAGGTCLSSKVPPWNLNSVVESSGMWQAFRPMTSLRSSMPWQLEITDAGIPAIVMTNGEAEHEIESSWRQFLRTMIRRPLFDFFWLSIIALNAIIVGAQIQYYVTNGAYHPTNTAGEIVFTILFLTELVLRLGGTGFKAMFCGPEWAWTLLDVGVISVSILDVIFLLWDIGSSSASWFRALRLLRTLRVAKVIRGIRFLRNLRLLIVGMINSVLAISWTVFALILIMYVGALVSMSMVADAVLEGTPYYVTHWSGIVTSMCTLFQVMTGDGWWTSVANGLLQEFPVLVAMLMVYYCVTAYGLLNIVTGIFVEQTLSTSQTDAEFMKDKNDESKQLVHAFLMDLFGLIDHNRDGKVNFDEFELALAEPQVQFGLGLIILKARDVRNLFLMLDTDGDGCVDVREFVDGCKKAQGCPTNADIIEQNLRSMSLLQAIIAEVEEIKACISTT